MSSGEIVVLVVEDEPLIRLNIVAEPEDRGLQVLEASNALEAISILGEEPLVNVLFTDVGMPGGLDGLELARIVERRYPVIQVIVTSGHRQVVAAALPATGTFLPKPYVSETVVQIIVDIPTPRPPDGGSIELDASSPDSTRAERAPMQPKGLRRQRCRSVYAGTGSG